MSAAVAAAAFLAGAVISLAVSWQPVQPVIGYRR